jgi:hypothetical protein
MTTTETAAILTLINRIAQAHGCTLTDVNLEDHIIDLEGPDDNKVACALALEEALGSHFQDI